MMRLMVVRLRRRIQQGGLSDEGVRRGATSGSEALGQAPAAVLTSADGLPGLTAPTVSEELLV